MYTGGWRSMATSKSATPGRHVLRGPKQMYYFSLPRREYNSEQRTRHSEPKHASVNLKKYTCVPRFLPRSEYNGEQHVRHAEPTRASVNLKRYIFFPSLQGVQRRAARAVRRGRPAAGELRGREQAPAGPNRRPGLTGLLSERGATAAANCGFAEAATCWSSSPGGPGRKEGPQQQRTAALLQLGRAVAGHVAAGCGGATRERESTGAVLPCVLP